jgi:predicted dehydrogenase
MLKKYHESDAVLCGVCDPLDDRASKACSDYGIAKKYSDYKAAITETKPDIVVVATPAYFHCDIASFAMDNGCHVLTEKPFDLSLAKCFELQEKQKKTGKSLAIGLQYRNAKHTRALKRALDKKLLGRNIIMHWTDIRENRPKIAMHDAEFGNGGPITDVACHYYDLMRWYYNSDPVSVSAVWRVSAEDRPNLASVKTKAPDTCVITVEYQSGDMGCMIINWGLPTPPGRAPGYMANSAIGSEGFVMHKDQQDQSGVKILSGGKEIVVTHEPEDEPDIINSELGVYNHLIAEIEGSGKVQVSIHEGILSLACCMASIKSGVLGRAVKVSEMLDAKPTILGCMK